MIEAEYFMEYLRKWKVAFWMCFWLHTVVSLSEELKNMVVTAVRN